MKKVTPSFPATPSKNWDPVKTPLFENLVGDSTPSSRKWGAHYDEVVAEAIYMLTLLILV